MEYYHRRIRKMVIREIKVSHTNCHFVTVMFIFSIIVIRENIRNGQGRVHQRRLCHRGFFTMFRLYRGFLFRFFLFPCTLVAAMGGGGLCGFRMTRLALAPFETRIALIAFARCVPWSAGGGTALIPSESLNVAMVMTISSFSAIFFPAVAICAAAPLSGAVLPAAKHPPLNRVVPCLIGVSRMSLASS